MSTGERDSGDRTFARSFSRARVLARKRGPDCVYPGGVSIMGGRGVLSYIPCSMRILTSVFALAFWGAWDGLLESVDAVIMREILYEVGMERKGSILGRVMVVERMDIYV